MAADNLQTVIVSKKTAKTRKAAERVAREFANRIYTSRETATSWRFRQRPPEDFRKGSFRTKKIDGGVSLVYGTLKPSAKKKAKNPDTYTEEVRLMYGMERRVKGAENAYDLAILAREIEEADLASPSVRRSVLNTLMAKAKRLRMRPERYKPKGMEERDWYFKMLLEHPIQRQRELFENPGGSDRLKNPRTMPDPGPMAWYGSTLEWKWEERGKGKKKNPTRTWKSGKQEWMFLWSPKYKAVVAIKIPKMKELEKVSRRGGAAKMFERFMSRDPKATHEAEIPACKLVKLGKAIHIVYRSDKWKHGKETEDYIHDFGKGVELYCGPSKKNPEVFICFGGKLTATERGLVF